VTVTPYVSGADPESSCTHTYQRVSSISDTGTWDFTVTVEWDVTWVDSLGGSGTAEPLPTEPIYPSPSFKPNPAPSTARHSKRPSCCAVSDTAQHVWQVKHYSKVA